MLRDVMTAVSGVTDRLDAFLVTGDAQAQAMAAEFDFGVIEDTRNESETAAIEMATEWCERQGYDTTIVVPGDIPLITAPNLIAFSTPRPQKARSLCPPTIAAAATASCADPASIIPLRFGNDSFLPHCEAMRQTGKPLIILEMPGIGLDIDNPHELELLVQRAGDTHAQRMLRSWGIASPTPAAWEVAG